MKKYGYIAFVLCVLAGCASQKTDFVPARCAG